MPYLTSPKLRLHYQVEGPEGAPWLVLLNSLGTDLSLWAAQRAVLARHFHVLSYDARGHGDSTAPAGEYTLAELGGDALALCEALGIARAHVCGISLGGLTAMWLGVHAPARVERLVLSNTAARIGSAAGWSERIGLVERAGMAPLAEAALERWFSADFRAREPVLVARFREQLAATDPRGYAACCAALRDADLRGAVAGIRAPALVIAGQHDGVTTVADARWLADEIPGARLLELPAAHLANVEAAAAFTAGVLEFLR